MPDKFNKSDRNRKKEMKKNNDNIYSSKHIRNKEFFFEKTDKKNEKKSKKNIK